MKILVLDNQDINRKGICTILYKIGDIESVEEAKDVKCALEKIQREAIDMVVLEMNLGKEDGLEFVKALQVQPIKPKVLVCTSSRRHTDFEHARELGVDGYVFKSIDADEIVHAIQCIKRGQSYFDYRAYQDGGKSDKSKMLETFTQREREVFKAIGKGLSNHEIGEALYISENTVKKHIASLMGKMGVKRRTEIALYAAQFLRRKEDA